MLLIHHSLNIIFEDKLITTNESNNPIYFKTAEFVNETFRVISSRTDSQFCKVALTSKIFAGNVKGSPFR